MKKALTLSIVIPVYNEENHLGACLDAIAAQSVKPDEVIVVNNNSTDASALIAGRYSFVRVISEPKQGIVHARNCGFNAVSSEIIGRIDADIILPTNWVERVKDFYADPDHLQSGLSGGGRPNDMRFPKLMGWLMGQIAFRLNRLLLGHYILFGSNMAIPKTVWLKVRKRVCVRTDIHEDLDLAIHVHELGSPITYQENLRVSGRGARLVTQRRVLWPTLLMWPRTLKTHHKPTWVIGLAGAVILYVLSPIPLVFDKLARLGGRPPLDSQ